MLQFVQGWLLERAFDNNTGGGRTLQHNTAAVPCPKCQGITNDISFHPSFPVTATVGGWRLETIGAGQ